MAHFIYPTVKRITSHYGSRVDPITGKKNVTHSGIDFAQAGTHSIKASARGIVSRSYRSTSYGETVFILHVINGVQYETVYAHMRSNSRRVKVNQRVNQGQVIGTMGNTGNSTGQHLHFEIHKGRWNMAKSNSINPLDMLKQQAPPTPPASKQIKKLQSDLRKLNYEIVVDGINGKVTVDAVKRFQKNNKLTVDGIAGKNTLAKIERLLKGGLTVAQAKKLQDQINQLLNTVTQQNNMIEDLQNQVNSKEPRLYPHTEPSNWVVKSGDWERAKYGGYFDGSNPKYPITKEQTAKVVNKLADNIEKYHIKPLKERIIILENLNGCGKDK